MSTGDPRARILDLEHLARQTADDRELEREVLALFLGQCMRLTPLIAGEGGRAERANAAHALKGAALAIGAVRVAELAGTIEGALDGAWPDETLARISAKLDGAVSDVTSAVELRRREAA